MTNEFGEYGQEHMKPHKQAHSLDSWRLFRILAEFVDGFEAMTFLGPSVAVFGSTNKEPKDRKYYDLAEKISEKIVQKGFGIITGGGPGIMECANKGAQAGGGKSCGLCINLPMEERPNPYIDSRFELNFRSRRDDRNVTRIGGRGCRTVQPADGASNAIGWPLSEKALFVKGASDRVIVKEERTAGF